MKLAPVAQLCFLCLTLLLFLFLPERTLIAQGKDGQVPLPEGENVLGHMTIEGNAGIGESFLIDWTSTSIDLKRDVNEGRANWSSWKVLPGMKITNVAQKIGSTNILIMLVGSNGIAEVYTANISSGDMDIISIESIIPSGGSQSWEEIQGDALYARSTSYLYVSRNLGKTWNVDSMGLNGGSINGITLDTSQYVYAATTNGVFKQHPDSSVWYQLTNLPTNGYQSILVDRRNRIFAAYYANFNGKGTYISTDNGSTWTQDSAGIGTMQILKLSDDAYGNTYAIANGYGQVYRRANNTPGWTRIEGGIDAITVNTTTFNSVGGDSVLYAATSFGLYSSTDQGTTWTEANEGIPAENISAFAKGAGGKWFTTTSLGMYSRNPADTVWSKVFPTTGYLGGLQIYTDVLGNIYTFGPGNINKFLPLYKSTNGGTTWNIDTAGYSKVTPGIFIVDETGTQHLATTTLHQVALFSKPVGESWGLDTAGFQLTNSNNSFSTAIASDRHGYVYLSGSFFNGVTPVNAKVMRRPIAGGKWAADTAGLSSYGFLRGLVPAKNGDMFGSIGPYLVRCSGGTWSTINSPSIAGSSISSMVMSVDSSGALFVSTYGSDANFSSRGLGVYFSTDAGATWTFAGGDSIRFTQLVSYGDSTFGCSGKGLYVFTRKAVGTTGVQQVGSVPTTYALYQNYPNPFNPTTVIAYQLKVKSFVTLTVYDLLGRKVTTLVNQEEPAGSHSVYWDAANFSSGIYFYQLKALQKDGRQTATTLSSGQAGSFVETKKMILMK